MPEAGMIKMSALARRAGVAVPTIKHYLREGLLPEPERTSRNMAYYRPATIERVKAIKHLQATRRLPLRVIKDVMQRLDDAALGSELALEAAIARVLGDLAPEDTIDRKTLLERGFGERELAFFVGLGVVTPLGPKTRPRFEGDDAALLRLLLEARAAGLTAAMLPPDILQAYVEALRGLARVELKLFRAGVVPRAGADLERLTEIATSLSERLVVLLRRKLLLPTLRKLLEEELPARPRKAAVKGKKR